MKRIQPPQWEAVLEQTMGMAKPMREADLVMVQSQLEKKLDEVKEILVERLGRPRPKDAIIEVKAFVVTPDSSHEMVRDGIREVLNAWEVGQSGVYCDFRDDEKTVVRGLFGADGQFGQFRIVAHP